MRGIFYRSDTRHPLDPPDSIFDNGLKKRDARYLDPVVRFPATDQRAPDIVPQSAVCFTRHFEAAPLFPVSNLNTNAWVYVLDLDTSAIYNSQVVQYEYIASNALNTGANATQALWPMFGQERAINEVSAKDIVGAVEVSRHFNAANVFNGGTFTPLVYLPNPNYKGEEKTAKLVQDNLKRLVKAAQPVQMPTMASGVVHSTRT
jgi:hypothetical protein